MRQPAAESPKSRLSSQVLSSPDWLGIRSEVAPFIIVHWMSSCFGCGPGAARGNGSAPVTLVRPLLLLPLHSEETGSAGRGLVPSN